MVEKILIICKNILYISWSKSLASLVTVHRFKNHYLRKPGEQRSKLSSHRLLEFHERLKQRLSKTGNFHPSLEISSFPRNEILWSLAPRTWVPRRITANLQHPLPSLSPSLSLECRSNSSSSSSSSIIFVLFVERRVTSRRLLFGCIWPLQFFKIPPNLGNRDLAFPRKLLAIFLDPFFLFFLPLLLEALRSTFPR